MSPLVKDLDDYLSLRRQMGYKLERAGMLLPGFVALVERDGGSVVTTKLALEWACLPKTAASYWWAGRLTLVRGFAKYLHGIDARHEVPPVGLIAYRASRVTPYLYSESDIESVLRSCARLHGPLMSATYSTLFGLLYVTGIRVGEAIALDRRDFHASEQLLVVRHSKFGKSREVMIDDTTVNALAAYGHKRDGVLGRRRKSQNFFLSQAGTKLLSQNVWCTFARLRTWAGLPTHPRPPRIHDLRHSFAVRTLIRWYREGADVESRIALLSTYLGHVNPSSTYWYLSAAPELMQLAAQRLESALRDL
jgi:site-specific recombinase XerD